MCINLSRPLDVDCLFKCLLPAFFFSLYGKNKSTKNNEKKNPIACGYKPSVYGKKYEEKNNNQVYALEYLLMILYSHITRSYKLY